MKFYYSFFLFFVLCSCHWLNPFQIQSNETRQEQEQCVLDKKTYPIQSALHDKGENTYKLTLLNTPFCFKNPLILESLRLGRLDENETKEQAQLDYIDTSHSTLYLKPEFQIKITETKVHSDGSTTEMSSMWAPLAAGLAGAAVGGLIAKGLSRQPQYVTPPSPSRDSSLLKGLDKSQLSSTPPMRKYKSGTTPTSYQKKSSSFFGKKKQTTHKKYSKKSRKPFFKRRRR